MACTGCKTKTFNFTFNHEIKPLSAAVKVQLDTQSHFDFFSSLFLGIYEELKKYILLGCIQVLPELFHFCQSK